MIKDAERILLETQETKSYLGSAGDKRFAELIRPILLGDLADDDRIAGVQTPGGCGALRLGFELIATANPNARVLIGTPTWPNHPPIIRATGLQIVEYPYYDRDNFRVRFDDMLAALDERAAGRRRASARLLPQSDRRGPERRTSGRRSPASVPSGNCCRSSTSPTKASDAASRRMPGASAACCGRVAR